ncbi:MAG: DUF3806 domain-containing protein [Pirellulales bacterium]
MTVESSELPTEEPLRLWNLPGDVGTVLIPEFLTVEMEDDETLLAYAADDAVNLRISCLSIVTRGPDRDSVVQDGLPDRAKREGNLLAMYGENPAIVEETTSEQDGEALIIRRWHVGSANTLTIVSLTTTPALLVTPTTQQLLGLMPRIIESVTITRSQKIIIDENGKEVTITKRVVEETPQELLPFTSTDNAWLDESRRNASALGLTYGDGGELTPALLDVVFRRWVFDEDPEKEDGDTVADALGAAFGDYLVEHHGFYWLVIKDEWGSEPAVKHREVNSIAFPRASVVKRIEDRETDFFRGVLAAILHGLAELKSTRD